MSSRLASVLIGLLAWATAPCVRAADLSPGTILDATTAERAQDLLPPELHRHFAQGEYRNPVVEFPDARWAWDDGFAEATRQNGQRLALDEHKTPVDRETGKRPEYIQGLPFPDIREDDPDAGAKAVWNLAYAYYTGGNSRNVVRLDWVSRAGVDRSAIQDVSFLYYDGQPRSYAPSANPGNFLFQYLAQSTSPADLQGTAFLGYRYKDSNRRDASWAYVPALRRVREVSPANRSDGFLGSDQSQDDGFFFDGKPEDFTWKLTARREGLRFVDPDSIAGKVRQQRLPGGGWRTVAFNDDRAAGFQVKDWKGVAWAPAAAAVAKRRFWVLEGVPKDKYYLYGKLELWIDDVTWQGAWNRKFSWRGELLNVYQVVGLATAPLGDHERWSAGTFNVQVAENVKAGRATLSGLTPSGQEPVNDRRVPLDPARFDVETLARLGK
jgi:hypothetical protein